MKDTNKFLLSWAGNTVFTVQEFRYDAAKCIQVHTLYLRARGRTAHL